MCTNHLVERISVSRTSNKCKIHLNYIKWNTFEVTHAAVFGWWRRDVVVRKARVGLSVCSAHFPLGLFSGRLREVFILWC